MGTKTIKNRFPPILILPFIIVLFQLLNGMLAQREYINCDVALFLQAAQLILKGKVPYVDFVEFNSPLIFYASVPVVWAAQSLHLPFYVVITIFTWLLIVYALMASFLILRSQIVLDDYKYLLPLLLGLLLLNFTLFAHTAQREQLFVLLFFPFFLLRWQRRRNAIINPWLAALTGSVAAIGICIKPPFFPLLMLAIEAYWIISQRKILARLTDPEIISVVTTCLAFGTWFFVLAPKAMRDSYLLRWAPLAASAADGYYRKVHSIFSFDRIGRIVPAGPIMIMVTIIGLCFCKHISLCLPLIIWIATAWIIHLIQGKGFAYHSIPLFAGCFILANIELGLLTDALLSCSFFSFWAKLPWGRWNKTVTSFALYSIMLCICLPFLAQDSTNTFFWSQRLKNIILSNTRRGDYVLILSCLPPCAYPCLLEDSRKPASRYLATIPFPEYETLKCRAPTITERSLYDQQEHQMFTEICEDVYKTKPILIAVDSGHLVWPRHILNPSIFSYMTANDLLPFLRQYKPIGSENGVFLWRRSDSNNELRQKDSLYNL